MTKDILPDRYRPTLFTVDVMGVAIKELIPHLELPFFGLSKRPSYTARRFGDGRGNWIELLPGYYGLPTIFDQDIMIYCTSAIIAARNRGETPSKRVHMRAWDLLDFANRQHGGRQYRLIEESLYRITTTSLRIGIQGNQSEFRSVFGIVDEASFIRQRDLTDSPGSLLGCDVVLSDRMMDAIARNQVLTLSRGYFGIRRPLDRRVYQIARKHCGRQESFQIGIPKLFYKSGTASTLKRFRQMYKDLVTRAADPECYPGGFPEYIPLYDSRRDVAEFLCREERVPTLLPEDIPSADARAKVKELYPGWIRGGDDPIGAAWRAWKAKRDEPVREPDAAYLGFAHKWVQGKIQAGQEPESCRLARAPSASAEQWWESLNPAWRGHFGHVVQERYGKGVVFESRGDALDLGNMIRLAHARWRELEAG